MVWLALACTGPSGHPGRSHVPPPAPDSGTSFVLAPGCQQDPDNALRFRCGFDRDATGPIEVDVTGDEGTVGFPGDPDALTGEIDAWDLVAETPYDWALVDRGQTTTGSITTPPLPPGEDLDFHRVLDGPTSVHRLVFTMTCGDGPTVFVADGKDRIRWYQVVSPTLFVTGFDATDRGSVLVNDARSSVLEWGWDGVLREVATYPDVLPRVTHHAVLGRGGSTVVLDTEPVLYPDGRTYLMDGITAIDGRSATHRWDVAQVLDPQGLPTEDELYWTGSFPNAIDFGHENAIDALPDGGWLVSFKHLDAVIRLDPDFALRWWMAGGDTEARFDGPRLTVSSSTGLDPRFGHQHHVTMEPDGKLLLFDNGRDDAPSRVLEIAIDEAAGTADVQRQWDIGRSCPVQSSAFRVADGTVIATCVAVRAVLELGDHGLRRETSVLCGDNGAGTSFVRAQPVDGITP